MALKDYYDELTIARAVLEQVNAPTETIRKHNAKRRISMYLDDMESILVDAIAQCFNAPEVRDRLMPFLKMACANSILKRVVDEIARPCYSKSPRRAVSPDADQATYRSLVQAMGVDQVFDLAARLTIFLDHVLIMARDVGGEAPCLELLTPDMFTVITDPDHPTKAMAVVYEKIKVQGRSSETVYVVWDEAETFEIRKGTTLALNRKPNPWGRLPFVDVHRRCRWGKYWDTTTGADLEAAQTQIAMINALVLKLHKSQGEKQMYAIGDIGSIPKDQVIDGEGLLTFPEGTQTGTIDLIGSSEHYLKTKENIETTVAANYGISRDRLNQSSSSPSTDVALRERTNEVISAMKMAEQDLFRLCKAMGFVSEEAVLRLNFTTPLERVDRKTQLEIREMERSMGLRSILDDYLEDNPEVDSAEEALRLIDENMAAEALFVKRRRELNAPAESSRQPGQSAEDNGSNGPKVRDGEMTPGEAADAANPEASDKLQE